MCIRDSTYLVIPEGVYRSMNPRGTAYGYLWVDCDKKDVASVEQSLNTLISNTSHIKMDTYHAQLQSAEFASSMMKLGCYLFMAIVGLIGFMNMANTMIMNITTKKQEYGILPVSYTHLDVYKRQMWMLPFVM